MIEPARTDRDVYLCGDVHFSADYTAVYILDDFVTDHIVVYGCVVCCSGIARFISYPSLLGICRRAHGSEDDRIRLIFSDGICPQTVVVNGIAAAGTVPPYLVYLTVLGKYFSELIYVIVGVFRSSPEGGVSVPRGNVYSYLETVFATRVGKFSYQIPLTVLIRAVFNGMLGVF